MTIFRGKNKITHIQRIKTKEGGSYRVYCYKVGSSHSKSRFDVIAFCTLRHRSALKRMKSI